MSLCESPSRTSPSPATTPRLFALWDRAYFDLYAMLPYQSVSVSGEHLALTTGLYFLKRQLPNLRFVQLPDSCQGTDGWDRYLENLGLQWARHRATEGEIVLCYPGDWTLTHNEQLRQEINDLSPVIPEKL